MDNFLVLLFIIIWIIEFYLFGMQRASLLISRQNDNEWKGVGDFLLPKWYSLTWIIRILKYAILLIIFIISNWKLTLILFLSDLLLVTIIPIPYKTFYKKIFRNRVNAITKENIELGEFYSNMLDKSGF